MYSKSIKFTILSLDPVARYLSSREKTTLLTQSIFVCIYIYICVLRIIQLQSEIQK